MVDQKLALAVARADLAVREHPELRVGQALWNALMAEMPEAVHDLAGSELDCFYEDRKVFATIHAMLWRTRRESDL